MKVLFLTRRFFPNIGGVEKHVLELSRELIKKKHRVTIITENPSNYHLKHQSDTYSINSKEPIKSIQTTNFEANQLNVLRFNFGKDNFFKKFRIWVKLLTNISMIKDSDIVHCHDVFFWYLPFRFLFPTKKVFTTFHGHETKFPPTLKSKIIRKVSEKLSFGNICVGDFIKKWYGTKPDYVTYGGIKESQNSKVKIQKFGGHRKKLNILMVGRLEEDNGAKIYLQALKKLNEHGLSYNLTVCGDGKFRKRFEVYGEVKGFVHDLNKYIDRADFIFVSSYLSIIEALSRSKNVFSVFQNRLKEDYLKLSPFKQYIFIAGNASSLVKRLISSINNLSESHNRLRQAQKWSQKQTWAYVAHLYLELWRS